MRRSRLHKGVRKETFLPEKYQKTKAAMQARKEKLRRKKR